MSTIKDTTPSRSRCRGCQVLAERLRFAEAEDEALGGGWDETGEGP